MTSGLKPGWTVLVFTCVLGVLISATSCHTFVSMAPDYTDIPAEGLRAIALEIERAVIDGVREPSLSSHDGIVVNSEAVQHAIRTRAARSELITAFRDTGHVAEMRNGLIDIVGSREYEKSTRRGDRARNALLIMSENDDRWILYESILKDNHFPPRSLSAVQRTFYEARITVLSNGQRYEDESGDLVYVGGAPLAPPPAEEEE